MGLDTAGNGEYVSTSEDSSVLTVWRLEGWRLAEGTRYVATNTAGDPTRVMRVEHLVVSGGARAQPR